MLSTSAGPDCRLGSCGPGAVVRPAVGGGPCCARVPSTVQPGVHFVGLRFLWGAAAAVAAGAGAGEGKATGCITVLPYGTPQGTCVKALGAWPWCGHRRGQGGQNRMAWVGLVVGLVVLFEQQLADQEDWWL